jgi:hypothetical protein
MRNVSETMPDNLFKVKFKCKGNQALSGSYKEDYSRLLFVCSAKKEMQTIGFVNESSLI